MSTFVYAKLTNAREVAAPGTSTTTASPGLNTYVDAFAALVPLGAILGAVTAWMASMADQKT